MLYVPDRLGRFTLRPFYTTAELDVTAERTVADYLKDVGRKLEFPLPTEVLTNLIERMADDLDLYCDLSDEGPDVHGITDFFVGSRPKVRISKELSEEEWREHRLRTTLCHELGHILCHECLFCVSMFSPIDPSHHTVDSSLRCHQDTIELQPKQDWMEWQANYVMGGVLMPFTHLERVVREIEPSCDAYGSLEAGTQVATDLVDRVAEYFDVSRAAAHIRLLKLGYVAEPLRSPVGANRGA